MYSLKLILITFFTLPNLCFSQAKNRIKNNTLVKKEVNMFQTQTMSKSDLKKSAKAFFKDKLLPSMKKRDHNFLEKFNFLASIDPEAKELVFDVWSKVASLVEKEGTTVDFVLDDDICEVLIKGNNEKDKEVFMSSMIFQDGHWVYYED